jgi:hypothetical protein
MGSQLVLIPEVEGLGDAVEGVESVDFKIGFVDFIIVTRPA